jgi:hypothetical protein
MGFLLLTQGAVVLDDRATPRVGRSARAVHARASRSTYRGAQLAIATKWCYVVYNKASRIRGRARATHEAHGSWRGGLHEAREFMS